MKRSDRMKPVFFLGCLLIPLLLAGCAKEEPVSAPTPAPTEEITPQVFALAAETQQPAVEITPAPDAAPASTTIDPAIQTIRDTLYLDRDTLQLVGFKSAIFLYSEPSKNASHVKLKNTTALKVPDELIVLSETTSAEGDLFYQVRAVFSEETGYVLEKDTRYSKLAQSGVSGFAQIESNGCFILADANKKSTVLAIESDQAVRILGEYKDFYYILTEDGTVGFAEPAQLTLIEREDLEERLALASAPGVLQTVSDPLKEASAANAAKMLRAGVKSASVDYWNTAQSHSTRQGQLKKDAVAMLSLAAGTGQVPVGREGIQFLPCLEVPPLAEGEELQQGLDFNIHGSIFTDSPLTSVSASFTSLGQGSSIDVSVSFRPEDNIRNYSICSEDETVEGKALDTLFDISLLRAGRYHFTLTAKTVAKPEGTTLQSVECKIVDTSRIVLTRNKFDDNYVEANRFFGGDTGKFLFHYSLTDDRGISTENDWRNKYIVESSLGRVHSDAVPYFEAANHYLENTYICVTIVNPRTGKTTDGRVTLLKDLIEKETTYVPRFQSNLEYVSHHTLGTAIDVNDNMYPNFNVLSNHDLVGSEVKQHLVYNGIKTAEDGKQYYDFTYDGSYSAKFERVPKTIINYLLYELAFFRAGFQWGYYYETACDGMHFMLTENDINRHMHTDIGLRKVYAYIDPEWFYSGSPAPAAAETPVP
ncbi:MAG TPA: M15 family metallopeptidase [Clostridia bacterium]|nr:M15 family metallopeptidase [Clostridia bacterium]